MKKAVVCLLAVSLLCSALPGCAPAGEELPVVTAFPPQPNSIWDYSGHDFPDEEYYVTQLIDLDALGDGKARWAMETDPSDMSWKTPEFSERFRYDLRSCDASGEDLSVISDFNDISFGTDTFWPDVLPEGFSPEEILEFNKNPGLSIRDLHQQGFTGKGVGVAIIDQGLYTGHEEYAQNLKTYELIHCSDPVAKLHGPAVASIAVGRTVGVAPEADLYYISSIFDHFASGGHDFDASIMADCVLRMCEINQHLPQEGRIRVISISRGYRKEDSGYEELQNAIRQADEQGILVLTASTDEFYPLDLRGLSRSYFDDPDDPASYRIAYWLDQRASYTSPSTVCVPMGSRAYAAVTGPQNYEINYAGGLSWAVPWLAGFYALCCQARPEITPAEFIELIKDTVQVVQPPSGGEINMIDPEAVIARLTG